MKSTELFYENIKEGTEIPGLSFGPITTEDMMRWACARGNYHRIHYDKDFAREEGHPDVLVAGPFKLGLMDRMIRDWIGEYGQLKKISAIYRGVDLPGNVLVCKGKVLTKSLHEGEGIVHCELWVENQKGKITTKGTAVVKLPLKGEST